MKHVFLNVHVSSVSTYIIYITYSINLHPWIFAYNIDKLSLLPPGGGDDDDGGQVVTSAALGWGHGVRSLRVPWN